MSSDKTEQEPTMEEILASIRRIISEGDDAGAVEQKPAPKEKPAEPAPVNEPPAEEDVLELTDVAEEPAPPPVEEPAEPEEPMPEPEPEPESEPMSMTEDEEEVLGADEEPLMSKQPADTASATFANLTHLLVAEYAGAGKTLEDMVADILRPMLKGWLDENLPSMVERMVAKEITRLSRRKGK